MKTNLSERVALGPLLTLKKGKKPESQSSTKEKGMQPYVDIKAFETGVIDNYTDDDKCVPCEDGDLLIVCDGSRSGYVGRAIKGYTGSTLAKISAEGVDNNYLYYFIQSMYRLLNTQMKGTGTPHLNVDVLRKAELVIPSILEQKRIVNKIEELFSELDSAVETLKKTKEQLAVYRNSIIDSSLPKCDLKTIKECLISMGQGWSPKCLNHNVMNDEEWAVIKTTSVQHGSFHYEENKALPQSLEPRPQHELVVGDLLITRAGPRVRCGVCCLVKETKKRLLNCDKVYRMKVDEKIIFPEYMELVLNSPNFVKQIDLCKTGGSESGLNLTQDRFLKIEIPVPSKNEQKNVIKEIAFKLSTCENIEKTVNDALIQADAMRQSILKKAFEGSL